MRKQVSASESSSNGSVGTLARGLDVLELFATDGPELSQKEISDALGLAMPTVHRLTKMLSERGYLVRDDRTRRFRLGMEVARLLPALLSGLRLPELARDHLRALAEATRETVNLAVLHRGDVVYLLSETGSNLLTLQAAVGLRLPAHCTALGKCLLAQLDDEQARRAAGRQPYHALTPHTCTTWDALRAQLDEVRATGVAISREEYEIGLDSIAVPVAWLDDGDPVAINVSLPSSRDVDEVRERLVHGLLQTSAASTAAAGIQPRAAAEGSR
jgi:IclR family acetate operon transcriptional repressor